MEKSDDFLKDRIVWRAKQHNCPSKSVQLFESVEESNKKEIQDIIDVNGLGLPVLYFLGKNGKWTLVSTKGLVFKSEENIDSIKYDDVKGHTIGDDPFNHFSDNKGLVKKGFKKSEQDTILVKTKSSSEILSIKAKKGTDTFTLYNIFLMILRMSGKE